MAPAVKPIQITLVLSFLLIFSCSSFNLRNETKINETSLKGLWYYTTKHAQYCEVYFNDSTYFHLGDDTHFVTSYKITEGDSLQATVYDRPLSYKLKFINQNSFTAATNFGTTVYTRIPDTVFSEQEWQKIFERVEDDETFQKYRLYYFARWDDIRKR